MRISIGHRLFASVLLAMLAVAAAGIVLMRHNVMRSFSEYAANIELDRLEELSRDLGRRHAEHGSWQFLPQAGRRGWIAGELARLQRLRAETDAGEAVRPPAPARSAAPAASSASPAALTAAGPAAPVPTISASPAAAPRAQLAASGRELHADSAPALPLPPLPPPPVPAVPPAPPAPPVLAATPAPPAPPAAAAAPAPPSPDADVNTLGLQDRVTLLDAAHNYLAGHVPRNEPGAERPVEADGRVVGYLRVARVMTPSDALAAAFLGQLKASLWAIVAASVALSALAAVLLASHFRRPIRRLAAGAQALAEGRFDTRLADQRSDELGELAHSFNQLAQRLDTMEASRRQWVADTSHELRTPLAVLRAQLEAIEDGVRAADAATVAAMLRQVLALNKLIDQLYALARADVGALDCQRQPLDLWQLACESAAAFDERLRTAELALSIGRAPSCGVIAGDTDRLRQVFGNLFENALRYTSAGGRVALNAEAAGGQLSITVADSAPGVPDEALDRLAERFYRVDASRSRAQGGAGLGLALCQRIVEAHGGAMSFAHSPLGGLAVTLSFALEQA